MKTDPTIPASDTPLSDNHVIQTKDGVVIDLWPVGAVVTLGFARGLERAIREAMEVLEGYPAGIPVNHCTCRKCTVYRILGTALAVQQEGK